MLVALLCTATMPLATGCGMLRGVVGTTLHSDLSLSREVTLTATGMFANMLANAGGEIPDIVPEGNSRDVEVEAG